MRVRVFLCRGFYLKKPTLLIWTFCLVFVSSPPVAMAQQSPAPARRKVPLLRAGLYYGRTGTALGTGVSVEVNPIPWFGLCAFASRSRATTMNQNDPVVEWDAAAGACATAHLPEVKGFLLSPFVQWTQQSDHNRVSIPLGDGATYQQSQGQTHQDRKSVV